MSSSPAPVPSIPVPFQRKRDLRESIGMFAVQCCECHKWRVIPTKDEYETIRENFTEDPWFCSRRPGCSCGDPANIEYDTSNIWFIDLPDIPKPPPDTERLAIMRRDLANMDICYVLPDGKYAKCPKDVHNFLDENPEYKDNISVDCFSFTVPKVVEETVADSSEWRAKKATKRGRKSSKK